MTDQGPLIAHVDMDAFFVSVELLRRPDLRGKPVIVGRADDPNARGVVTAASYEARRFGVHSALPLAIARRRCPQAIVVNRDMGRYREASAEVMEILRRFSDEVEVLGLDEAYLDLGGCPTPRSRARRIKHTVREETGLVCSVGIGSNRLLAKIASDLDKPDGLFLLRREDFLATVGERSARLIPGIGPKTAERLERLGIRTVAELARADRARLEGELGPRHAEGLRRRANGHGSAELCRTRVRKSESRERTFDFDQTDPAVMRAAIEEMSRAVAGHLGEQGIRGRTVTLKIRLAPFRTFTRSRTLDRHTCDPELVAATALALFERFERDAPVRLLGVGISSLDNETGPAGAGEQSPDPAGPVQLMLDAAGRRR